MSVAVREARREDAEAMARAHTASAAKAYGRPEDLERRTRRWREVFDEPESRQYLAEADGEVVGVLGLGPDELHAIYVHPDWWGRGGASKPRRTKPVEPQRHRRPEALAATRPGDSFR